MILKDILLELRAIRIGINTIINRHLVGELDLLRRAQEEGSKLEKFDRRAPLGTDAVIHFNPEKRQDEDWKRAAGDETEATLLELLEIYGPEEVEKMMEGLRYDDGKQLKNLHGND